MGWKKALLSKLPDLKILIKNICCVGQIHTLTGNFKRLPFCLFVSMAISFRLYIYLFCETDSVSLSVYLFLCEIGSLSPSVHLYVCEAGSFSLSVSQSVCKAGSISTSV
jgi:hypothetical protein